MLAIVEDFDEHQGLVAKCLSVDRAHTFCHLWARQEDPALEMRSLAVRREPLFSAVADIVVECGELDPEQLTAEVARRLESAEGS